ncbi:transcriptional regulator [Polyangium mundeleinium]|uniref:Transcriptional regulator n=1 Tax=Polyangium mundeleinium TaxID=2995306 RepID=A0ABT5EVX8_9BACT|nr:transcriptional regulator [Polyangium mundeleinium]MDC0745353.1 transcriptional regulator [Polyangium mundeleinium]
MLRLVHPAPRGQGTRPPKGRKSPSLLPTSEERKRIRATIRNVARAYGGLDVLAAVVGVHRTTLIRAAESTSYAVAVLLARAAGIPVEQVLAGRPHVVGACALCGRKGGAS